jgi:hypothetical protein
MLNPDSNPDPLSQKVPVPVPKYLQNYPTDSENKIYVHNPTVAFIKNFWWGKTELMIRYLLYEAVPSHLCAVNNHFDDGDVDCGLCKDFLLLVLFLSLSQLPRTHPGF